MLYTTYFAKLKCLPDDVIPIAICAKPPIGFKGYTFKQLAPEYDFFKNYKETGDEEYFTKCYNDNILSQLSPIKVYDALYSLTGMTDFTCDIALVCYEKSSDFCHRHLVANWFNEHGITCKEYKYQK